jgi:hypothetical protein
MPTPVPVATGSQVQGTPVPFSLPGGAQGTYLTLVSVAGKTPPPKTQASLSDGGWVMDPGGEYVLIYNSVAGLRLYEVYGSTAPVSNGTFQGILRWGPFGAQPSGATGYFCVQSDGNCVVYDGNSKPIWTSYSGGTNGQMFVVQSDGNVVMYQWSSCWNTGTG